MIFYLMSKHHKIYNIANMNKRFDYRGPIILGMHDAIVSLTGLIAGLGLALQDKSIIVLSCIISSVTASLSMGAANYLAVKTTNRTHALRAALHTGNAYMLTCVLLIFPFFVFKDRVLTLCAVFLMALCIIFFFNFLFYNKKQFLRHFYEMLAICSIVSFVAFVIGEIAKYYFGV